MRNKDLRERIKYSKEYKNNIVIGIELREIIVGVILGDATVLRRYPNSDAVIKFCQGEKNKDYLYHLYEKFEPLVATPPKRVEIKREKLRPLQYYIRSIVLQCLCLSHKHKPGARLSNGTVY